MVCDLEAGGGNRFRMEVPSHFKCPISLCLMSDPVSVSTGITYDRLSIVKWIEEGHKTCPVTMQPLSSFDLIPNHTLRRIIHAWSSTASPSQQQETSSQPAAAKQQVVDRVLDYREAKLLVREAKLSSSCNSSALRSALQRMAMADAKGREHLLKAGAPAAVAELLEQSRAVDDDDEWAAELLSLISKLGLDDAARKSMLGGGRSLQAASRVLQRGSMEARLSCASVLEQLADGERERALVVGGAVGIFDGLVRLLREGDSGGAACGRNRRRAVRAAVAAALALCSPARNRLRLVEAGAVAPLVEMLPGAEPAVAEAALAALEIACGCAEGRAEIARHALAAAAIARQLFKVSPAATESAIDVLWALCKYSPDDDVRRRVVDVGLFPKLFFFLQVGCNPRTKHKAADLLRLLNRAYRECCLLSTGGAATVVATAAAAAAAHPLPRQHRHFQLESAAARA